MSDSKESKPAETFAWTVLAHLLRPQGRKGELLAELLTDFPARFDERTALHLAPEGFAGSPASARSIRVISHWLPVGRNQGRIVLGLEGIDTIEKAEALAHLDVVVPDNERVELEADEAYIDELIGCTVFDGDATIGTVTAVDFPTTPDGARRLDDAAPLLTVTSSEGDEILIPYVQTFLISISVEEKAIHMRLPEGLLELNRK